ncbi:hypothetical protein [Nocardia tengchongensis]
MCRPTRCRTCGKTTWSGCGAHVAQVRASVPADQWCPGHENTNSGGWIRRLLTR